MTVGIFFPQNLPKIVTRKIEDPWRRKIASMFIEVNLLCEAKIKAILVDQNLECWKIIVNGSQIICTFKLPLIGTGKNYLEIGIDPQNDQKLKTLHFFKHSNITAFADLIDVAMVLPSPLMSSQ